MADTPHMFAFGKGDVSKYFFVGNLNDDVCVTGQLSETRWFTEQARLLRVVFFFFLPR